MSRTIVRLVLVLVGVHLLLGLVLLVIQATHGINDQDASFAVAMVFYCLNLPTFWLLRHMGGRPGVAVVVVAGVVQWAGLALLIGVICHAVRSGIRAATGQVTSAREPSASDKAQS